MAMQARRRRLSRLVRRSRVGGDEVAARGAGGGSLTAPSFSLGPLADGAQPHATDERTARIDRAPVGGEASARVVVGGEDARLGDEAGPAATFVFEAEVHRRLRVAGLVERGEGGRIE